MDDRSVCTPLLAESDTHHNTTSTPNAASVTDADKVINTQIDSTQVEGDEEERLEGLLADDYCHVCEAVLLFESQRLSHYEGKKHAQKLKVYVQAKRAEEDMDKESARLQRTMTADRDHFCELCTMVFSSHVVAKSHYEGKVHAKNLRKQGLQPPGAGAYTEARPLPRLVRGPDDVDQNSSPRGDAGLPPDPTGDAAAAGTELDLKDPNKRCALCAAAFNNPQMALQHYNGRKHQRNQARRELLKELGDDVQQANSLMCQMCSVQFNSVEMYQAHMQGNKHQIREKKVVKLCKSQQKDYNTFADELADYIQVQKARGIAPKAAHVPPPGDARQEGEEEEEEEEAFNQGDVIDLNQRMPSLPPTSHPPPPHHSRPGGYYAAAAWRPPHQGPPWPPHHLDYSRPPPVPSGSPLFTNPHRKRCRKQPSSSSGPTSSSHSSSSSFSSSTSDSDDGSEYRRRGKRRMRRSRRPRDEDSDKEEKKTKRRRREGADDSEERRREESGGSEKEAARKKRKNHGKQRKRENKSREEDFEVEGVERGMDSVTPEMQDDGKEPEVHVQAEMRVEPGEGEDDTTKPKYRKEKKKTKEKADTRTEEEKLWDDSILGC